ncbi:MAG: DUF6666 family protein, partial [Planctomycetota bacterium]
MRFVNLVLLVTAFVTGCGIQSAFAQYNMPPGQNSWKADRQQRLGMIPPTAGRQRGAGMPAGGSQPGVTEQPLQQMYEQMPQQTLEAYQAPRQASRIASQAGPGRVAQTAARGSNGYLPQKFRTAQADQPIEAPVPRQAMPAPQAQASSPMQGVAAPSMALDAGSSQIDADFTIPGDDYALREVIGESYLQDGGSCASCGDCETGCQDCIGYGRVGGVPPGYLADCWMFGLGRVLREAEYFGGAQAFQTSSFLVPGSNERIGDCSFGFYSGLNLGLPLRQLTCGLVSGQFGVRTVQSDFSGDLFSSDNRDQLFLTTGFYRRVDYGLQFGVVMDYLRENWFTNTEVIQMRGDLAWVNPT